MRRLRPPLVLFCASLLVLSACLLQAAQINPGDVLLQLLEKDYAPESPLLPDGVKVVTQYRELSAPPIGIVDFVENEAFILHADAPNTAFKAEKSKPIYQNDTLVTQANARVVALMKDQSQFTLAAASKITLEKSVYDAENGTRDTKVSLAAGKARFVVQKLKMGKEDDFQVQTPLAVIGVRGSDFVVAQVPSSEVSKVQRRTSFLDRLNPVSTAYAQISAPSLNSSMTTVVLSGSNTTVGMTGLIGPPVIVSSFQITAVPPGSPPAPPLNLSPQLVPGTMNRVGPAVSVMSMPRVFE